MCTLDTARAASRLLRRCAAPRRRSPVATPRAPLCTAPSINKSIDPGAPAGSRAPRRPTLFDTVKHSEIRVHRVCCITVSPQSSHLSPVHTSTLSPRTSDFLYHHTSHRRTRAVWVLSFRPPTTVRLRHRLYAGMSCDAGLCPPSTLPTQPRCALAWCASLSSASLHPVQYLFSSSHVAAM